MTKKEAMERYSILIPEDFNDYDKEKFREFDNMYLQSFYSTFFEPDLRRSPKSQNGANVAIVLGGQAGAGKSSIVAEVKRKFKDIGRRIVVIDDDCYRKFYPYSQEILENCPEYYTEITATATTVITPKILKFASESGYNFIFDGTMKNTRIINTMKTWENYDIYVCVMATCGERSLLSTAIRNAELRNSGNEGRLVEQENHWEMYHGVPDTLRHIEQDEPELVKQITIFSRTNNPLYPREVYSSKYNNEKASNMLEILREKDREEFFKYSIKDDIEYLKRIIGNLSDKEKMEAQKVITELENSKASGLLGDTSGEQFR